ncbi:ImmA/IrrE family metallo-endopeptidase [Glycomyces sp. A-F 0318]|uniref:ImmA/IrrE family metallo-endopeptidase n=1 Tax=Glycomyces amatae TaxID=2881355 RepID=UPI001E6468C2|nr:ImmA/IrrE family metallo-endopeptidase [Glycomyces amatae]MCD0443956.1 ImmA/IrrE family metallo-endopeptidase [Glycomyces amatae]
MLRHLEQASPGAAARLAKEPFAELANRTDIRVVRMPELIDAGGAARGDCSVSGSYDGKTRPATAVVAESLSSRRQHFTLLHELGHHLQQSDPELGEAALSHERSKEFEDAACDAFAAEILLPAPLVSDLVAAHGPTVEAALELFHRTSASRAAICVRLAAELKAPGVAAVIEASGTVSFAAAHGNLYPPRRGSDQRSNPLIGAALAQPGARGVIRRDDALIEYSTGRTSAELYGQAAWCGGLLLVVMVEYDAHWRAFAPPREGRARGSAGERWADCGVCETGFAAADRCPRCLEPRCPEGHCECTRATERLCSACFLLKHPAQFKSDPEVCDDCCS